MGTVIYEVALAWWLVEVTGSAKTFGIIMAATTVGIVLISPFSGICADYLNKKKIMIITDLISGLISIAVSFIVYKGLVHIPALVILSFFLGLCSSLFRPANKSIIPLLVKDAQIVKANSILENISETTKLIGPLIAGVLIAVPRIGAAGALLFNGISFILSALSEYFIAYRQNHTGIAFDKIFTNIKEGFKYILKRNPILSVITVTLCVNIFLAGTTVILPLYIQKELQISSNYFPLSLTLEALGGIVITLLIITAKNFKPEIKYLCVALAMEFIPPLVIFLFPNKIVLLVSSFLLGCAIGCFNSFFISYLQLNVDKNFQGRVFSIIFMLAHLVCPVGYLLFGFIGDYYLRLTYLIAAIGIFLCSVYLLFYIRTLAVEKN